MNDDRISEVYKGEIWTDEAQARARRRINWMCSQARGDTALDIGTSQGIAAILLAREGFKVVGVDIQPDRIEYAIADLEKESDATRGRATFQVAEGSDLPFDDDSFDTVLLGEVIEHLAVPQRVLAEAQRVLKPGGRIVITTPFGVLHHHDHKQTFYPASVMDLISNHFGVTSAEVEDRYFRIVGEKGADTDPSVVESLDQSAVEAVRGIQEELASLRIRVNRLSADLDKAASARDQLKRRADELGRQVRSKEKVEAAWRSSKQEVQRLQQENTESKRQHQAVAEELRRTAEQAQLAGRLSEDLAKSRRSIRRLEQRNAKLQHQVEIRDWKMASLRQRRWWRLGAELGAVRRNPAKLLSLPFRILELFRNRPPRLPRPAPPAELSEDGQPDDSAPPPRRSDQRESAQPIIPRRSIPVLGVLAPDLGDLLAYEVQLFQSEGDDILKRLAATAPSALIIDSAAPALSNVDFASILEESRSRGVSSVLWDRAPERVPAEMKARFDVIHGSGKPPSDTFEGRLVAASGSVEPRVHNPILGQRRTRDVAVVEPEALRLDGDTYADESALVNAARGHEVVRAIGAVDDGFAARMAATATPLLIPAGSTSIGIEVESEEETTALERSLMKSEVTRARLVHPLMRTAFREHSLQRDIDLVLGMADTAPPRIDVMVATKRPEKLETVLENLGRQTYPNLALWLVAHGVDIDAGHAREMADRYGVELATVTRVDESVVLGEVFNIGFAETEADIVAKMDDDDFYGPEYLWDLYSALDFSGAEVAGKWAHYVYLEGVDSLVYRFKDYEHRYTEVVAISTLLMHREVLDAEKFPAMPWGSGSVFLRALGAQGGRVFAGDRWNYLYIRGTDGARNTFPISDMKMLANSDVVCRGMNLDEVVV